MEREAEERGWGLGEGDELAAGLVALDRLGGGHRYEAYLAWHERMHALVVAKVVRPHLVEDEHTLSGLRAEAAMLERLAHPVLLRSFGQTLDGERPYLILEHIEGPRLSTLIRKHGPLPAEQLVPLATQLFSVLHYLAAEGVVHLDVKPANIIMSGPPRLIDLSVALRIEEAERLSRPVGTDSYMAPEQCEPKRLGPVGPAADVWGVGVALHRAASGERPFRVGDPEAVGRDRWPQLQEEPVPIDPRRHPQDVRDAILDCLRFNPDDRPGPAELAERFETILAAKPRPRLAAIKPRWR